MEFLSQAIGEIDTRHIVGAAISVFVAALRPLLGVVTKRLSGLRDRRSGEADSDRPGLARRQPLRSHRQPSNRPARPFQGSTPEKLARSMRCFGRVPISHYRHRRSLVGFWRLVKLNLLPVKALPKSAFAAVDWQYEPSALTGLAAGHPFCGGFELRIRLHRHENRWHLRRSLQVGGPRSRSRRLVVLASARDIFDPESWVRCLVVDSNTLCLPKQSRGWVAVRGADPSSVDVPVVHRRKHKDVPDGAGWLIVPTSAHSPPAAAWGETAERLDQQTRAAAETAPPDCSDIDNEDYVRRLVKRYRIVTSAIWAVLGPVVLGLALGLAYVYESSVEGVIVFWAWYSLIYATVAGLASGQFLLEVLGVWRWRRRENQARKTWKGGTDECLIMGNLLRRGPILTPKQWAQHCAQVLPQ